MKAISDGILELQENGELAKLKTLWWKKKYGGNCPKVSIYRTNTGYVTY